MPGLKLMRAQGYSPHRLVCAEVEDYVIDGDWACDGTLSWWVIRLVVCTRLMAHPERFAGSIQRFMTVVAGAGHSARGRLVGHYGPGWADSNLECLRMVKSSICSNWQRRGSKMWLGRRMENGWRPHRCAEFMYLMWKGKEIWRSDDHPSTVSTIAWSGSEELATACYGRADLFFNASTGELFQKLEWKGSLVSMVLSSDGNVVACGSQDNSVHFWRRDTGQDSQMHGYPGKAIGFGVRSGRYPWRLAVERVVTVWSSKGCGPEVPAP